MEQKHHLKINLVLLVCLSLFSCYLIQKAKAATVRYATWGGEVKFTNIVFGSKLFNIGQLREWANSGSNPCRPASVGSVRLAGGEQPGSFYCGKEEGKTYKDIMVAFNVTGVEELRRYHFNFSDPLLSSNYYTGKIETSKENVKYIFLYMDPGNMGSSKEKQSGWCNGFIRVKKIMKSTDKNGTPFLSVYVERKVFPILADLSKRKAADPSYVFPCPNVGYPIQIIKLPSDIFPNFKYNTNANKEVKIVYFYSADKIPTTTTTFKGVLAE